MNCLNSNYKRLIDAGLECEDEEETNVDELRAASEKQRGESAAANASTSGAEQQPGAPRYEYRTDGKTRILPIKRGGEKQSETHYFVIPPPVVRVPIDETDSQTTTSTLNLHEQFDTASATPVNATTVSKTATQTDQNVSEREKITLVTNMVHGVTEEEARMALGRSRMNVDEACRYLSIEQLFRLGFSREQGARALATAGGSLEKACTALLAARFPSTTSTSTHRSDSASASASGGARGSRRT